MILGRLGRDEHVHDAARRACELVLRLLTDQCRTERIESIVLLATPELDEIPTTL